MNLNFFKDVDSESFWLTIWSILGIFLTIFVTVINYNMHLEDQIVAQLIREGHDPQKLACVYVNSDSQTCQIMANEKLQKTILDTVNGKTELTK